MAILMFDGFDDYAVKNSTATGIQTGGWAISGNVDGSVGAGARTADSGSAYGQRVMTYANPSGSFVQDAWDLGTNYTSLAGGFAFYVTQLSQDWYNATLKGERLFAWYDSANVYQCELVLDWYGRFHFCRGTTILASGGLTEDKLPRADHWNYLEWEITMSQTVGTFELWVNGIKTIDATGLDTCDTANVNCRYVRMSVTNGVDNTLYFDDFYVTDGTRLTGAPFAFSLHPNSDGGVNVWTALSGTDEFAMVDENTSDGDTTYNQASTAGDESRHGCEDLPSYVTSVLAVGAYAVLRKTDATAREARVLLNSGGTESLGNTLTLTTAYLSSRIGVLETDPNTAAAWTLANVNAVEVGYEVVT